MKTQEELLSELLQEVRDTRRYAEHVRESSKRLQSLIEKVLGEDEAKDAYEPKDDETSIEQHRP